MASSVSDLALALLASVVVGGTWFVLLDGEIGQVSGGLASPGTSVVFAVIAFGAVRAWQRSRRTGENQSRGGR